MTQLGSDSSLYKLIQVVHKEARIYFLFFRTINIASNYIGTLSKHLLLRVRRRVKTKRISHDTTDN